MREKSLSYELRLTKTGTTRKFRFQEKGIVTKFGIVKRDIACKRDIIIEENIARKLSIRKKSFSPEHKPIEGSESRELDA